jgi:hypothetical protein
MIRNKWGQCLSISIRSTAEIGTETQCEEAVSSKSRTTMTESERGRRNTATIAISITQTRDSKTNAGFITTIRTLIRIAVTITIIIIITMRREIANTIKCTYKICTTFTTHKWCSCTTEGQRECLCPTHLFTPNQCRCSKH